MDEAEQRELGMAMEFTVLAGETFTPNTGLEIYCVRPKSITATLTGVHAQGGITIALADGTSRTSDTHLSSTGLVGGSAVTITGDWPCQLSSVTGAAGTGPIECLVRNRT